jgi:hypothetical protein
MFYIRLRPSTATGQLPRARWPLSMTERHAGTPAPAERAQQSIYVPNQLQTDTKGRR